MLVADCKLLLVSLQNGKGIGELSGGSLIRAIMKFEMAPCFYSQTGVGGVGHRYPVHYTNLSCLWGFCSSLYQSLLAFFCTSSLHSLHMSRGLVLLCKSGHVLPSAVKSLSMTYRPFPVWSLPNSSLILCSNYRHKPVSPSQILAFCQLVVPTQWGWLWPSYLPCFLVFFLA